MKFESFISKIISRLSLSLVLASLLAVDGHALSIKVLTYNTWLFGIDENTPSMGPLALDVSSRATKICNLLKSKKWDVVFLQEVWAPSVREKLKDCGYYVSASSESVSSLSGLLTLSRWKVVTTIRFPFINNGQWDHVQDGEMATAKSLLLTQIETPEGPLFFGNIHAVARYEDKYYDEQRSEQLKFASGIMDAYPRAIFAGDFNVAPVGYSYSYVWDDLVNVWLKGWAWSAPTQSTYTPENPNILAKGGFDEGSLDHIFSSPGSQIHNSHRALDQSDEIFSDHFGWEAVIEF